MGIAYRHAEAKSFQDGRNFWPCFDTQACPFTELTGPTQPILVGCTNWFHHVPRFLFRSKNSHASVVHVQKSPPFAFVVEEADTNLFLNSLIDQARKKGRLARTAVSD